MRKSQLTFAPLALTLLLSVSASAGIMETAKPQPAPTPAPTSVVAEGEAAEVEGIMTTSVSSQRVVGEVALSLLQSVLALF